MKFSVLVNNFNYARFLPETLASVAAQTLAPHEIIVVDDGSSDESIAVLESLRATVPNLRVHPQSNGGQLSAMRSGIRLATGDWCMFLDADDTWEPGHLAVAARALAASPEAGAYYSGHRETLGPPVFRSKWPAGLGGPFRALVSATGVRIGTITSTIALRKDHADALSALVAEFEPDWRIRADDVFLFGAAFAGSLFLHEPSPTVRYRIHGANSYAHGDHAEKEAAYRVRLGRLFDHLRRHAGIDPSAHFELLVNEFRATPPRRRSHEVVRRYRRAIYRQPASFLRRLQAVLEIARAPRA